MFRRLFAPSARSVRNPRPRLTGKGGGLYDRRLFLEPLEQRQLLSVSALFSSGLLTVSLDAADDHAFISYDDGADNVRVGTTDGGSDVYAGTDTITSLAVVDTGTAADQLVTFSGSNVISKTGGGNLTTISVTDVETANVGQLIAVTTLSGDAEEANVSAPGRIQHGIDLVASGGTVNVAAGTYVEAVLIDKHLTMTGAGSSDTAVQGMFELTGADATTVQDLAIVGNPLTITDSDNVAVTRVIAQGGERGLWVEDSTAGTFTDVTVQNITRSAGSPIGVQVRGGGSHQFSRLAIENVTTTGGFAWGLYLTSSSDNDFTDTVIRNVQAGQSSAYGMYIHVALGNTFTNTVIDTISGLSGASNQAWGALFQVASNNEFTNTSISNLSATHQVAGIAQLYQQTGNTFENLDIDGLTVVAGHAGASLVAGIAIQPLAPPNPTSGDHVFQNVAISGLDGLATSVVRGVYLKNTTDIQLSNVSVDVSSASSVAESTGFYFLTSSGTELIDGSVTGAEVGVRVNGGTALVTANDFTNNAIQIIDESEAMDLKQALASNTFDRAVTVRDTGTDDITVSTIFSSIQDGVDAASTGDTVSVGTGTYAENVDTTATGIDKSIVLSPGTSPGQVTIDGNLKLDADDTLAIEVDGLIAGTGYDQLVVNGTVTLGGAALSASGTLAGVTAGSVLTIIDNDAADAVVGTFAGLANGDYVTISGTPFRIYYNGGTGNDVVLINASPVPETWVDDDWVGTIPGAGIDHDGNPATDDLIFGMNAFDVIQDAIDSVDVGGTVNVGVGGYTGSIVIDKSLSLIGPQANVQPIAGGRAGGEAVLTLDDDDHPLQIVADDVVVNGLELAQFFYGPEIKVAAVADAHRSNVTLAYNYIHSDRTWSAVVVGESTGSGGKNASGQTLVSGIYIEHNIIDVNYVNKPGYTYNRAFSFTTGFPRDYANNHVTFSNISITNNDITFSGPNGPNTLNETMFFAGGGTTSTDAEFHFEDFEFNDNVVSNFRTVMNAMNFRGASFQRNTFENIRYGLYINVRGTDSDPAVIKDNVFDGVLTGTAVNLAGTAYAPFGDEYVDISGNFFNYNELAYGSLYPAVWFDPGVVAATINVNGNSFVDGGVSATPGPALQNDSGTGTVNASGNWWGTTDEQDILDLLSGPVDFTPYLADGTDTDPLTPGFQGDFSTLYVTALGEQTRTGGRINEAIGLVTASTVVVNAGTYNERVTINKPLTLLGAQAGVDARGRTGAESIVTEAGLSTPNPDVLIEVTAAANGTTIDGFTLYGDQTNTTADTSVIRAWSDDLIVRNNIVDGMHAVIYKGGDGITMHQNDITGNKTGFVVQPSTTTNVTVTDNAIRLGTAPIADASGVYMTGVDGATISGNTITGFDSRGIGGSNWTDAEISGNNLSANRDGISLWGNTTFIDIVDNDLDSVRYGINIKGQDIRIEDNRIDNSGTAGINIERHTLETERVTVLDNVLTDNITGIRVSTTVASGPLTFEGNTITGGTSAFDIATASEVFLTNNTTSGNTSGGSITNIATVNLTTNDDPNIVRVNVDGSGAIALGQFSVDGQLQAINYTGVVALNVNALEDEDTVWVAAHPTTVINLDGGDPTPPADPGDTLIYVSDGVNAFNFGSSKITTDTKADIDHVNFESTGVSGNLVLDGTGDDDLLVVNATNINSGTYQLTSGGVAGPVVAFSSITSLTFSAGDGYDILRINNPAGGVFAPTGGIGYDGGSNTTTSGHNPGPGDALEILGGSATSVKHVFSNASDGFVHYDGSTTANITYTGLEPIDDTIVAADRIFTFDGAGETITLSNDTGNAGRSRIVSTLGESVSFANPTGSLTIDTTPTAGIDAVRIEGVDGAFDADLAVTAKPADTVTFQTNATDIVSGNLSLTAGTIVLSANVTTTGNATLAATTAGISGAGTLTADDLGASAVSGIQLNTTVASVTAAVNGTGSIGIVETNGLTVTSATTHDGAVTISAGGAMTASSVTAGGSGNNVSLTTTAGGSMAVGAVAAAGDTVALNAAGAITDANGAATNNITAANLSATAAGGIELDTTVDTITAAANAAGDVTLRQSGAVTLTSVITADGAVAVSAGGAMTATTVTAVGTGKNVSLTTTAGGSIAVDAVAAAGDTVALNAAGAITDVNGAATNNITAASLSATAGGGIELDTTVNTITAAANAAGNVILRAAGAVTLTSVTTTDGTIEVAAGSTMTVTSVAASGTGGDVHLSTSSGGDIALGSVSATGDTVLLQAAGAITDGNGAANNVTASLLAMQAGTGIGAVGASIDMNVGTLAAETTSSGGIFLANTGALTIGGITAFSTTVIGVTASAGAIDISTSSHLTVD